MWCDVGRILEGGDPVALVKKVCGIRLGFAHILKNFRKGAAGENMTGLTGPENDVPLGTGPMGFRESFGVQ